MNLTYSLTKPVTAAWQSALNSWESHLRMKAQADRTVDTRLRHVRQFARETKKEPTDVTVDDVIAWAASKTWKPETRHAYYTSLRAFYTFHSTYVGGENVAAVLPPVRRFVPPPRPTPKAVVSQGFREADARGRLIIALAACGGLRAKEIAVVHLNHVSMESTYGILHVEGKGGKTRNVPIPLWLARDLTVECMRNSGYAFPGKTRGHLAPCTVSQIARQFLPGNWTLHTLRHRYATNVYQEGRDLLSLKEFLGHASVATTQRYAQPPESTIVSSVTAADIKNY